ncbi:hypothetical protein C7T35_18135 [Variovorax sp. WS11]|uniref:hypothetical protein n=1 Tax=Variovorax sp. WS11 TaxID=1105204 RepID=UPI000D0DD393|nr:hypothetical protein [Variovorax sp. WS11]NDZ14497.1 hypothetical protein [Variovorax sp. WS11]PSL83117.1 hypothetical protein C7T35_18135 [Variovorax sp. WS11]
MTGAARFREIVFMDDFFRSSDNTLQSHPANRRFLCRAFGLQARRLDIPIREMFPRSEGSELDVAAMMGVLSLPRRSEGWAQASIADLEPLAEAGLMPRFDPGTLVIGWGLSPSLMHAIDRGGASFIDLEIAPIRFASHLAFCARTNDRLIEAALAAWRIEEESYWNEAGVLQGYFSRRSAPFLFSRNLRVGLFCGQTAIDLALVRDGKIARPLDALEEARELAGRVDLLVIKPHPYEPDLRHLVELAAQIPNAAWTDENTYALLCADNLEFVCGLSSGALLEANYFIKPSRHLIAPDRHNRSRVPAACSDWAFVGPGIASLEGLARICAGSGTVPPRPSRFPDDALDRVFGTRWGLDAHSAGLRALPTLALDRIHEFHSGQAATGWLSFGWHLPEGTGVWTAGERACIVIPLDAAHLDDAPEQLLICIEGLLFVGTSPRNPIVRAWINGQRAHLQVAEGTPGKADARFNLYARFHEARKTPALVLEFEITDPQRPCDMGLGDDTRRLGFHLQRISMRPNPAPGVVEKAPARVPHASHGRRAGRHAVSLYMAAACLGLLGAAMLPAGTGRPGPSTADASRWDQIKHAVASGAALVRDDLHHLLHHG